MGNKAVWSPRDIYLHLVCLITLIIAVFSVANLVGAMAEMAVLYQRSLIVAAWRHAATLVAAGSVYAYHWRKINED